MKMNYNDLNHDEKVMICKEYSDKLSMMRRRAVEYGLLDVAAEADKVRMRKYHMFNQYIVPYSLPQTVIVDKFHRSVASVDQAMVLLSAMFSKKTRPSVPNKLLIVPSESEHQLILDIDDDLHKAILNVLNLEPERDAAFINSMNDNKGKLAIYVKH